jgi:hypothetical protein
MHSHSQLSSWSHFIQEVKRSQKINGELQLCWSVCPGRGAGEHHRACVDVSVCVCVQVEEQVSTTERVLMCLCVCVQVEEQVSTTERVLMSVCLCVQVEEQVSTTERVLMCLCVCVSR